jgi:hypothetical protein
VEKISCGKTGKRVDQDVSHLNAFEYSLEIFILIQ